MKISELIVELKKMQGELGDMDVYMTDVDGVLSASGELRTVGENELTVSDVDGMFSEYKGIPVWAVILVP